MSVEMVGCTLMVDSAFVDLLILLLVIGIVMWAFNTYVTIVDPRFKQIINVLVILAVIVYVLGRFGILQQLGIHLPTLH